MRRDTCLRSDKAGRPCESGHATEVRHSSSLLRPTERRKRVSSEGGDRDHSTPSDSAARVVVRHKGVGGGISPGHPEVTQEQSGRVAVVKQHVVKLDVTKSDSLGNRQREAKDSRAAGQIQQIQGGCRF